MAAAVARTLPAEAPAKSADFDYARYQEKIKEYVVKASTSHQLPTSTLTNLQSACNWCCFAKSPGDLQRKSNLIYMEEHAVHCEVQKRGVMGTRAGSRIPESGTCCAA